MQQLKLKRIKKKSAIPKSIRRIMHAVLSGQHLIFYSSATNRIAIHDCSNNKWYELIGEEQKCTTNS
ncbi:hypothetical protein A3K72_00735 [Candidatus Woesearchaeota archaeon RBG_13_36_6]|nr:MAG: hypothetical protein A3K72_00735 [Candidatus Woesearchaeota archaeon RBG_13_36_6]